MKTIYLLITFLLSFTITENLFARRFIQQKPVLKQQRKQEMTQRQEGTKPKARAAHRNVAFSSVRKISKPIHVKITKPAWQKECIEAYSPQAPNPTCKAWKIKCMNAENPYDMPCRKGWAKACGVSFDVYEQCVEMTVASE